MRKFSELDWNALWREEMGWNRPEKTGRQFDDAAELAFWRNLAPRYSTEYDLNRDTDLLATRLRQLMGEGRSVLEIGCGSGNFTLRMAAYADRVLGVDMSPAMLAELEARVRAVGCANVRTIASKWEAFSGTERFDYLVSVNSLYRICDIESALRKMDALAKRGVILIRTIQKPFLSPLYESCSIACRECRDYRLLPCLLWKMGVQANVEFVPYARSKTYADLAAVEREMTADLGEADFSGHAGRLQEAFAKAADRGAQGYTITMRRTAAFIYWRKTDA